MIKFKTLQELQRTFRTNQDCIDYLEKVIWNGKPVSPYDPTSKVYKFSDGCYKCKNTGKRFNVRTNTIFRRSKISLPDWFLAIHLFTSNKKGISSHQLARFLGIPQKTTWSMLHRIRRSLDCPKFKTVLNGVVEVDETFIGGKNKWRHWNKKVPRCQGRNWKDKTPVMGMLERGGNLICQVIPNTQQKTLEPIVFANVRKGANVYTDEWLGYKDLYKSFNHQWVNHSAKQYARGEVTTNSLEGFWSHLKRGIRGTYHQISRKHTQKYVDEFVFRYNTRKYEEQERFDLAILSSVGKQMTYRELVA